MSTERQYRCYVPSMDIAAYYEAKSAAAARYRCRKAAREAGYKLEFSDIRVRLALPAEEVIERQSRRNHNREMSKEQSDPRCEHCNGAPAIGTKDECQWCDGTGLRAHMRGM